MIEIDRLGEYLTDREGTSLILDWGIVSSIASDILERSESEYITIRRDDPSRPEIHLWKRSIFCIEIIFLYEIEKCILHADILRRTILEWVMKSRELLLWDIGEVIVLDDMYTTMKELEPDAERRESKIRRLYQYDDGSFW